MRPFFPKEGACAREKSRTHALLSFYQAIGLTAYLANVSFVLQELEVLCCVLGSDLDVVDPVVLLNVLALNKQLSSLGSLGSLAHVVVQNGTGHLAVNNILDSLFQCVNTDQVDVLWLGKSLKARACEISHGRTRLLLERKDATRGLQIAR